MGVLAEMVAVEVSSDFGYVALVAVGSWGLNFWQMMTVGKARKALNVEYPKMYSEDKPLFNCVMRAHQNTLENLPHYLTLLMLSGMKYPRYVLALFGLLEESSTPSGTTLESQ